MLSTIYTGNILEQDELRKEYTARAARKWTKSISIEAAVPNGWNVARQYKKTKEIEGPIFLNYKCHLRINFVSSNLRKPHNRQ